MVGEALSYVLSLTDQTLPQGLSPLNLSIVFSIHAFLVASGNGSDSVGRGHLVDMQLWSFWDRGLRVGASLVCSRGKDGATVRAPWCLSQPWKLPDLGVGGWALTSGWHLTMRGVEWIR